ncbi:MAG: ABC transporter substrate-binding protein [Vicinamibacterales bacterium]
MLNDRVHCAIRAADRRPWVVALAWLTFSALGAPPLAAGRNITSGCIESFDPRTDYFPERVTVEDAVNFSVDYRRSYKVVTVRNALAAATGVRYVLVQCGAPLPALDGELSGAQVVRVPVASVFAGATTHLPLLADLQRLDVLTGVPRLRDLIGTDIVARAATGRVREFAPSSVVDAELVVSSRPALFMTGGAPSAPVTVVRAAGIPVVVNVEWLEPTALGRAEWIKYMALFLNEDGKAQAMHAEMRARYQTLKVRASQARGSMPLVMTGRSTRGRFVIAGGRSYVAALIADAGGRYVWANNAAVGSASVDLETQIGRASEADYWINGGGWTSREAMLNDEPRYEGFKAYRTGQVWVYERRMTASGGNDYWSRSITHPDLVLADLIKIFHPTLASAHAFEWYMPVPAR